VCGHKAVANRAALAALHAHAEAGIDTRDIDDSSGVLLGTASRKARRALPPAAEERAAAIEHALREAAAHGVTAVHDIGNRPSLELLTACRDQHRLTTRVLFHMNGTESLDEIEAAEQEHGDGEWLVFGGIKLYLDGSIGARTAALREPYAGTSGERGELHLGADELESSVALIHQRGRQAVLHAIGDRAIEQALAALAPLGADQVRGRGHRIEHLELVPPDLLDRMADSGAIASMQPNFVWQWQGDGGLYEQRLGRARWRWMNRFRSIVQRGIPLVFGSDCMPLGPLGGITGAVEHPQQIERLSVCEAIHACTRAAAAIAPHGIASGRLAPGDPADFVILDRDPLASGRPAEVRVLATVVGGRLVHPSPASGAT
jgi:predicted amidohydrolase YtcJ